MSFEDPTTDDIVSNQFSVEQLAARFQVPIWMAKNRAEQLGLTFKRGVTVITSKELRRLQALLEESQNYVGLLERPKTR